MRSRRPTHVIHLVEYWDTEWQRWVPMAATPNKAHAAARFGALVSAHRADVRLRLGQAILIEWKNGQRARSSDGPVTDVNDEQRDRGRKLANTNRLCLRCNTHMKRPRATDGLCLGCANPTAEVQAPPLRASMAMLCRKCRERVAGHDGRCGVCAGLAEVRSPDHISKLAAVETQRVMDAVRRAPKRVERAAPAPKPARVFAIGQGWIDVDVVWDGTE